MLNLLKEKTLEEKISIIKQYSSRNRYSGRHANMIYVYIAVEIFNWEDAASFFMTEHVRERIREIF